jgi:hypothetical protein
MISSKKFSAGLYIVIFVLMFIVSGCGGDGESYLDMAFDDATVSSNSSISDNAWRSFEDGDLTSASQLFTQALGNADNENEAALAKEGLAWIARDKTGILSALDFFKDASPYSTSARVGYACALITRGENDDQNKAISELEKAGLSDPSKDFTSERKGTLTAAEVHAMAALAYFLRDYPNDDLLSSQHIQRTNQLLQTSYSKAADDTVKAIEMMRD